MSERLYYKDAYTTKFEAHVVEQVKQGTRLALVLDETYFYPTSGGQPHDLGTINDVPVVNVTVRKEDGAILHWMQDEVWNNSVTADIDWMRRLDHMQHHTGQHILSQAFIKVAEAKTIGFHLSDETVTIDLHTNQLTPTQIEETEELANEIVWQNRPIKVRMVTSQQAENLVLRKIPTFQTGQLRLIRLIDIEKFDLTACGGTHVARTGEIGMIKIVKLERRGEKLRVEFRCGRRAIHDYRQKNSVINQLSTLLTTGQSELVASVSRLQEEAKQTQRTLKKQQVALVRYEAETFLSQGIKKGSTLIIKHVFTDREIDMIQALGSYLAKQEEDVVVLFGLAGPKARFVFCRSVNAPGEMNKLLKPALKFLGSATGGGNESFAQGGGPAASEEQVWQAIGRAERLLSGQI